ncbi:putative F-box protein At3g16210 isoform X2 [Lathyrus oleraceus]|uniref:putative F-box protein At3g16210 isoform X2 n=1 Tax=Pisum sativum TaxID=3888 RepID=UPI0021CF60E8|nr:putative F-box protein At3g16210 isoform X2 [Pisum sativum]
MEVSKKKVRNYLPSDVSFDILSKLSVKALKRFTCVCKIWANLFENPQFINMYRINLFSSKYNDCHNSHLLLKQTPNYGEFDDNDNIFLFSGETFDNKVKLNWPRPFEVYRECIFIIGSIVNGILCLCQGNGLGDPSSFNTKVVLWNPSTEEFKLIPCGSFKSTFLKAFPTNTVFEDLRDITICVNIHGFGYDPITDDYKLIRFFYSIDNIKFGHDPNNCINDETLWQIYSLKSNCWRDLQVKMPTNFLNEYWQNTGDSMYFNGMCHWWGYEDYHKEEFWVRLVCQNHGRDFLELDPYKIL